MGTFRIRRTPTYQITAHPTSLEQGRLRDVFSESDYGAAHYPFEERANRLDGSGLGEPPRRGVGLVLQQEMHQRRGLWSSLALSTNL